VFIFGFLVFVFDVVGLLFQYHSQVNGGKTQTEMTNYVSNGMLNSLTRAKHFGPIFLNVGG